MFLPKCKCFVKAVSVLKIDSISEKHLENKSI